MRACWLKWVGRDWSISADYIWLNYSGANTFIGAFFFISLQWASRVLMTWSLVWLLLMCCLLMGRLLTRVLLVALLMFAAMIFVISILGYRPRFFVLRMPGI